MMTLYKNFYSYLSNRYNFLFHFKNLLLRPKSHKQAVNCI